MKEHLRIVQDPVGLDLAKIHPSLEGALATVEQPAASAANGLTRVTFMHGFDGYELPGVLSEPLAGVIDRTSPQDVRRGVKAFTYPNGRKVKNLRYLAGASVGEMMSQRPQLRGLMDVIDHPEHHEMVPAKVHVLDPLLVELASWDQAADMKPSAIKQFCDEHGITYDEMKVWRLKGGDRHNKTVGLADMGLDNDDFVQAFIAKHYRPKTSIPGEAPVYVPKDELPDSNLSQESEFIELLRQLPPVKEDELGDRWEVLLRREGTPRHVVYPTIAWGAVESQYNRKWLERTQVHGGRATKRHEYSWSSSRLRFAFDYEPPVYNPINHTIEHKSSLLGPILLAGALDPTTLHSELKKYHQGKYFSYWEKPSYMGRDSASMIALVQSDFIMAKIMDSAGFGEIRKLVRTSVDGRLDSNRS